MEQNLPRRRVAGQPVIRSTTISNQTESMERWVGKAWWITALPLILLITIPVAMLFTRTSLQELVANIGLRTVFQAIGVSFKTTLAFTGQKDSLCIQGLCSYMYDLNKQGK